MIIYDEFIPEPEIIVPDSVLRTLAKYPGWLGSCALCRGYYNLLEVKLPYDPVYPSGGRLVGLSVKIS